MMEQPRLDNNKVCVLSARKDCVSNDYLTNKLFNFFHLNGYTLTNSQDADIIIVTGCGVAQIFEDAALDVCNKLTTQYPDKTIVPAGCFVSTANIDGIRPRHLSKIDTMFKGNKSISDIPVGILGQTLDSGLPASCSDWQPVEISVGCANDCTFCTTKQAKGFVRSKPQDDIIREVESISKCGATVIKLIADDCGSYGLDIQTNIANLLNNICKAVPSIYLQLHYFSPNWLLKYYPDIDKTVWNKTLYLCSPIGSTTPRILKMMNRDYDPTAVCETMLAIRRINPGIFLNTEVIYGFPSETELELNDLLSLQDIFNLVLFYPLTENRSTIKHGLKINQDTIDKRTKYLFAQAQSNPRIKVRTANDFLYYQQGNM